MTPASPPSGAVSAPFFTRPVGNGAVLTLLTPNLAEPYHALIEANLARLAQWEPWANGPQTLEGTRTYLEMMGRGYLDGSRLPTVLVTDGGGWQLIGPVDLRIDGYARAAEIGFWIDAAYEGRGLVTRAARILVGQAFGPLGLGRVTLRTDVANERSRAVAERVGFREEGVLRGAVALPDGRRDQVVYGLLATNRRGTLTSFDGPARETSVSTPRQPRPSPGAP